MLGRKWGLLVFLLDFAKGAVPVAAAVPVAEALSPGAAAALGHPDVLRVGAAALAFLGHLFPIFLRFRGGKGVATGAGTVFVLVPGPASLAVLFWLIVLLASRTVSLASLAAVVVLLAARLLGTPDAFRDDHLAVTAFLLAGCLFVAAKHRSNIARLRNGTESRVLPDGEGRRTAIRSIHLLSLGLWFGGAAFFNFGAAPAVFQSFRQVVAGGPSDRTAGEELLPADASQGRRDGLASALAGAAVGPVFPIYFGMQAVCGAAALLTALTWWPAGRPHRWRVRVLALGLLTVALGWPLSTRVSELRLQRFDPSEAVAREARLAFVPWHLASLFLSLITVSLAGAGLCWGRGCRRTKTHAGRVCYDRRPFRRSTRVPRAGPAWHGNETFASGLLRQRQADAEERPGERLGLDLQRRPVVLQHHRHERQPEAHAGAVAPRTGRCPASS